MLLPLWFAKLTRDPTGTVTTFGLTPLFKMLMVAASPGWGVGEFPPPPPGLFGEPPAAAAGGQANQGGRSQGERVPSNHEGSLGNQ